MTLYHDSFGDDTTTISFGLAPLLFRSINIVPKSVFYEKVQVGSCCERFDSTKYCAYIADVRSEGVGTVYDPASSFSKLS